MEIREKVDVCVIGAGHAGCEADRSCLAYLMRKGKTLFFGNSYFYSQCGQYCSHALQS